MTIILNAYQDEDLSKAVDLLQAGKLVAVPTETVYGLAADARQANAVHAIFTAKKRPIGHPLIVHIGEVSQLREWASYIPDSAWKLAQQFWPGPLTLVLKAASGVSRSVVTGGLTTVALRMPAHPAMLMLLKRSGLALAAPSANPHKMLSPTSAAQVLTTMGDKLDAVLDGGECTLGIESTILDLTNDTPCILRAGPITASEIAAHLNCLVEQPRHHQRSISGNQLVHYRPVTPLYLKTSAQMHEHTHHVVVRLLFAETANSVTANSQFTQLMPRDKAAYARLLYKVLFRADQSGADEIWVEIPPSGEEWMDVHDRLSRASTKRVHLALSI
jgi:L-threonylcarbamoyladenylate synthase